MRRLWDKWSELWKLRNQALHGHDACTRHNAEQREIFRTLEDIYDNRHSLEPSVQRLLLPTAAEHRQVPLSSEDAKCLLIFYMVRVIQ
jgi:hypothetical protein